MSSTTPDRARRRGIAAELAVLAVLVATLAGAVAACEFEPMAPEPLPTASPPPAQAPSVSIMETFQVVDDRWTFTGYVDPRGGPTSVVLEIGDDVTNPTSFQRSIPVVDGILEPQSVTAVVETPPTIWLCVRFTATNDVGPGSSRPICLRTDDFG